MPLFGSENPLPSLSAEENLRSGSSGDERTSAIREISAADLATRIARGDDFDLIDVREPAEWAVARIDGARLVPLATIRDASTGWDRSREVVLYCRSGARSMNAAQQLVQLGFARVMNVTDGMIGWMNGRST